jgi:hypothetical protein
LTFEIYNGYGIGFTENSNLQTMFFGQAHRHKKGTFQKLFLSPNFGLRNNNFEVAISGRTTYLRFNEIKDMISENSIYNIDGFSLSLPLL